MIIIIIFLFLLAAIHAKMEIAIEGSEGGWAKNLPCKKFNHKILVLLLGKGISEYHIWMLILFLCIFHSQFLFTSWSIKQEIITLGLYCLYWIAEDFLWFMQNFEYGFLKLLKRKCEWHKRYVIGLPCSYFFGIIIGTLLLIIGYFL